ncbi:MAG: hypothetical protein WCF84_02605 [Anaerolineae bacterium]
MYTEPDYSELWNEMDELLIQYPELSELWLDQGKLDKLRAKYPGKEELVSYFRRRAFTSLVMEKLFRVFELTQDEEEYGGGDEAEAEEQESITIGNPELKRIWEEDVKEEYEDFPEFIQYVTENIFVSG